MHEVPHRKFRSASRGACLSVRWTAERLDALRRREWFDRLGHGPPHLDQLWNEIHFQRLREPPRGAEGDVDVAVEHLRHVGARHVQAARKRRLVQPQRLHLQEDGPEELRKDSVGGGHGGNRFR